MKDHLSLKIVLFIAKFGEEQITEKVYFEKYLKVSECIREFVLNNESNYYKEYLRNTKRRQANFVLDEEKDSDIENESDDEDYEGYYGGDYGGYDSDDVYDGLWRLQLFSTS
ncbi:hypothetical protein BpHYR1_033526 [Brachionus plicatilis]|uniref:Uncharacterized protein n=1 Tax=Brachionus plicatilis TaxID=10195 RepID=A0A3M7SFQ9_BRAPC|nr:hypothetical protein BpHYR1_033526 [Brachionus plicatilis]